MWSYIKLAIWGVFWFIAWIIMFPFKKGRENCLTWSVKQWDKRDGYLVIRWCRSSKHHWFKWPHFLYLPADKHQDLEHFIPHEDEDYIRSIPKAWFHGHIKKGDDPEDDDNEN